MTSELRYVTHQGGGKGRLVLVHALAMNAEFWSGLVPHLQRKSDIVTIDMRGHGSSPRLDGPVTAVRHADDIAAILDRLGWRDAVIAGASMGGCIAMAFAARHPARVRGLGLIDTTAWYGPNAPATWEERARRALDQGMASLVDFQLERWFTDDFRRKGDPVIDRAVATFLANDLNSYAETCRMLGRFDARPHLAGFNVPCRVILGEEDYATPLAMAQAIVAGVKGAELHVVEKARHFTPLEKPAEVAALLAPLL